MEFHDIIICTVESDSEMFNLVDERYLYDVVFKCLIRTYARDRGPPQTIATQMRFHLELTFAYLYKHKIIMLCILRSVVEDGFRTGRGGRGDEAVHR